MIFLLIIPFLLALILGVPIAFSLGIATIIFMLFTNQLPFDVFVQTLYKPAESFPLLAIPFFIFAGELMGRAGITTRLVEFAKFFIGRIKGGLAHVTVVTGAGFAGLSGSAVAETAALAKTLGPEMEKQGYEKGFSAALIASVGVMAPIIPPSVIMILYGSQMNVSIGAMFLAGIIPGIIIGIILIILSYIIALKRDYPTTKIPFSWKRFVDVTLSASLALIMPVIIIVGIRGGVFTPTEGGAVAAAYALLIGGFVYRTLTLKGIFESMIRTGITSATILLIVAMSAPFGWVMAYFGIPQAVAETLLSITENPHLILLMIILILMFIGMFLEGAAIVMLLGPVFAPIAPQIGVDPVHFAIVMVVGIAMGTFTPPVGVNLFVTTPLIGTTLEKASKAALPFILVLFIALLIIAFIPQLTLWLPTKFN